MRHSLPTRPQAAPSLLRDHRTQRVAGPGHDSNAPCAFRGDTPCGGWRLHGQQPRLFGRRSGYGAGLARSGRLPCVHRCAVHPPPEFNAQSAASGLESHLRRSFRGMRRRRRGMPTAPSTIRPEDNSERGGRRESSQEDQGQIEKNNVLNGPFAKAWHTRRSLSSAHSLCAPLKRAPQVAALARFEGRDRARAMAGSAHNKTALAHQRRKSVPPARPSLATRKP